LCRRSHFNVTEHPTARWTGQQIIEAFLWDTAPKYRLRDRDAIYGSQLQKRVKSMGIEEVLSASRSPWQNAFVERVIGSIRRDCLDHVVVLNDRHLKRILTPYGANIRTNCMISLSGNITDNLFEQ